MKVVFSLFAFLLFLELHAQLAISGFELGSVVTIHDFDDRPSLKLINDPSDYEAGEPIEYRDGQGRLIKLSFQRGTQILNHYVINDVSTAPAKSFLENIIGKPLKGYIAKLKGNEHYTTSQNLEQGIEYKLQYRHVRGIATVIYVPFGVYQSGNIIRRVGPIYVWLNEPIKIQPELSSEAELISEY